jgi:hypothetical protein
MPSERVKVSSFGIAACATFLLVALLYLYAANELGRIPIHRSYELLGYQTARIEFWTSILFGTALVGCGLGIAGMCQVTKKRGAAVAGFLLDLAALVVFVGFSVTRGY